MADFKIDRIRFTWKGDWLAGTEYNNDELVYYKSKTYVAVKGHTSADFNVEYGTTPRFVNVTTQDDVFYINGIEAPTLDLRVGETYIFDTSSTTNVGRTFRFSAEPDGTHGDGIIYTDGVTTGIAPGNEDSRVTITIRENTPDLFYFSPQVSSMGAAALISDSTWKLIHDGTVWQGDWQTDFDYNIGDIIKFKGYVYQCLQSHTSTVVTSLGPTPDIEKWKIVATTYNWLNTWTTNFNYDLGDVVTYNGITYICNTKHRSKTTTALGLEPDNGKWSIVTRADAWKADWAIETRYRVEDVIKYGAITYRCIVGHTSAATLTDGLEADQSKWEIVISGVEYKFDWADAVRYKLNDIVKYGPGLWICTSPHTSQELFRDDESYWSVWLPGLGYEALWDEQVEYQKGDIVLYGGYTYTALENNTGSTPSTNGLQQDLGDWELLKQGYNHQGDWDSLIFYKTGDVVRDNGYLYIAIADATGVQPDELTAWNILVPGSKWTAEWADAINYKVGDIVTYAGTAYTCILQHDSVLSDNRPDVDIEALVPQYWIKLIQGTATNVMTNRGDIRTFDVVTAKLPVGVPGNTMKVSSLTTPIWQNFEEVPKIFYVSPAGTDADGFGISKNAPFKTVKFACDYILADEGTRTPATVFVATGLYQEILPISVPANTAIVGDELRSTNIQPAQGFELSDMFWVRNGCGIRNMTLQGLTGTLGPIGPFETRRPSAGAYVSLDPGAGPDDESVWITTKSTYVQNVTTFGTGCVGMKVDGSLHNGGNKSIVANDFTQVLSDGIGYWAANGGRSELVSVFTYFNYIGYLATEGGRLRATNGNNSYGLYGSRAEGVNPAETPITGQIDNQTKQASIDVVKTNGQNVLALGYSNAGQNYTTATLSLVGSNVDFDGEYTEFRDESIFQIRVDGKGDSSIPGGLNYQYLLNTAQGGTDEKIIIAAADTSGTEEKYLGMRIVIESGAGAGQYGYITSYDFDSKVVTVSRESDDAAGWDHIYPGWPIRAVLDNTTRYSIEPRLVIDLPTFNTSPVTRPVITSGIVFGGDKWISLTDGTDVVSYTTDGATWSNATMPGVAAWKNVSYGNGVFVATVDGDATTAAYSTNGGINWSPSNFSTQGDSYKAVYGNGAWVAVETGTLVAGSNSQLSTDGISWIAGGDTANSNLIDIAYGGGLFIATGTSINHVVVSNDNGATWTDNALPLTQAWSSITYGNGRFVLISTDGVSMYSFDGVTWLEGSMPQFAWSLVGYGQGLFLAVASDTSTVAQSNDGKIWTTINDASSANVLTKTAGWNQLAFGNPAGEGAWLVADPTLLVNIEKITTGRRAVARVAVASSRIDGVVLYDPGSGYKTKPGYSITDSDSTIEAVLNLRLGNGVLAQPEFINRGTGYPTASATVVGDGVADNYPEGRTLYIKNLSLQPGPGDNLSIDGINDVTYRIVGIDSITGVVPNLNATVRISPTLGNEESPEHETGIVIRQEYSQVRLTGHDFLDIGTGNTTTTRYPDLYLEGVDSINEQQPFNETTNIGGGRVFYTSTDQDGNFRVGELFAVEQSTGIVSINADFFDLNGLSELSLGGIQVGGTAVVIREFSKDPKFTANSNNIVPTQAAIISYIESRISGGGADAVTNALTAGQIKFSANNLTTTSGLPVNFLQKVYVDGGADGHYLASMFLGI
jgi:hypothetical protein